MVDARQGRAVWVLKCTACVTVVGLPWHSLPPCACAQRVLRCKHAVHMPGVDLDELVAYHCPSVLHSILLCPSTRAFVWMVCFDELLTEDLGFAFVVSNFYAFVCMRMRPALQPIAKLCLGALFASCSFLSGLSSGLHAPRLRKCCRLEW